MEGVTNMDKFKSVIMNNIDNISNELIELSKKIHENPELCFKEFKAASWLQEIVKEHGFTVKAPCGNMETAFKASYKGKKGGPRIAFLAEYDALRGKGHACGHNVIAACAAGAAIGLSKVMDDIAGEIILLGTPAEEGGGGKIILLREGEFADIDYALMIHPAGRNLIGRGGLAATLLNVEFTGKAAHSSAPEDGINALQALLEVFKGIDSTRSVLQNGTKINGIITAGGEASNIITDYAAGEFTIRARSRDYLEEVVNKVIKLTKSAEIITGATPRTTKSMIYAERYPNMIMAERFKANMEYLEEMMNYPDPNMNLGSSDIGNVSMEVPTIHSYLKIVEPDISGHTKEFAAASVSPRAEEVVIKGAKGLAMTGYDILVDQALREKINQEFKDKVKGGKNEF